MTTCTMSTSEYRDADYDIDPDIDKTASFPEGLNESFRFEPNLEMGIRRTNSSDDISRYERYFSLVSSNAGNLITWRHYLKILESDWKELDLTILLSKMMLNHPESDTSDVSSYTTAMADYEPPKKTSLFSKFKQQSIFRRKKSRSPKVAERTPSIASNSSSMMSLAPETNILKKMCSETRYLARKISKTVEKISNVSSFKECPRCGSQVFSIKHSDCSPSNKGFGDAAEDVKQFAFDDDSMSDVQDGSPPYFSPGLRGCPESGETSVGAKERGFHGPHSECKKKILFH